MSRTRPVLLALVAFELLAAFVLLGWRLTRSQPPEPDLSRLPPSTAQALRQLRLQVWTDTGEAWRELGEAYLAFGYFAEAEPCLRLAAARMPQQFDVLFIHACSVERLGRLEEANLQFAEAARLGMSDEVQTAQSRIARNSLRLGDVAAAETAFANCPDIPAAQIERARLLIRSGRAREALPLLEKARQEQPLDIRTEMIAIQAFRELNRPRDLALAAERADRAANLGHLADPLVQFQPIRARYGLTAELARGEQFHRAGRHREAGAVFDRVLDENSWDVMELVMTTGAHLDLLNGRMDAALSKLETLATRMDVPVGARFVWGSALDQSDRLSEAVAQWQRALAAQPTAALYSALANGLQRNGDEAGARAAQLAARLQQAIDGYRSNQPNAALQELMSLRNELSEEPRLWYYLGVVHVAREDWQQARQSFERCLALDPLHGRAKAWLTTLLNESAQQRTAGQ